jgi:hypothetical protein
MPKGYITPFIGSKANLGDASNSPKTINIVENHPLNLHRLARDQPSTS